MSIRLVARHEKLPKLWVVAATLCIFMAGLLLVGSFNNSTANTPTVQASVLRADFVSLEP